MPRKTKARAPVASPTTAPPAPLITRADTSGGPVTITPAGLAVVARMAAQGHELASIAKRLGIGHAAFRECRRRQESVQEAIETGHAALSDELAHILLTQARGDGKMSVVAAIYLSKARCGWRENDAPEQRANITIVLPGAQTEEAYMRTLNAEALPAPTKKDVVR